ncbi:MAG: hypothetical protein ABIY46_12965 [Gemmatimonadales bacterium]
MDLSRRELSFAGIGNIGGTMLGGGDSRSLVSLAGIVGHECRKIQTFDYPLAERAVIVLFSDGLQSRWTLDRFPALAGRDLARLAALLYRDLLARPGRRHGRRRAGERPRMIPSILTTVLRYEQDVVLARQRARQVAKLLGFDRLEQTGIATAVSPPSRPGSTSRSGIPVRASSACRRCSTGGTVRRVAWASASSALGGSATGSWCARIRPPARSSS